LHEKGVGPTHQSGPGFKNNPFATMLGTKKKGVEKSQGAGGSLKGKERGGGGGEKEALGAREVKGGSEGEGK